MGLWLKCPGCNAKNPLYLRACPSCGRSLDNLSSEERVYVIGPASEAAPAPHPAHRPQAAVPVAPQAQSEPETPSAPEAPVASVAPVAPAAPKPAKQPKKSRKKKG